MKIAYLGPAASHSQGACQAFTTQFMPHQPMRLIPMASLTQVLEAVEEGVVDLGCVPVENALEGAVSEVLDVLALKLSKTRIVAEFVRPIRHALIRQYPVLEGIRFVHSHPQAIGQCREAIYELLGKDVKIVTAASTSEAVKNLLNLDETHAALGTVQAAAHYGLDVVVDNIGDLNQNQTLFLILSANQTFLDVGHIYPIKTSLCLGQLENKPGALLEILTILAKFQLNMSKIHSRPSKQCLGEYVFFIDLEALLPAEAEQVLRERAAFYRDLGIYPALGVIDDTP